MNDRFKLLDKYYKTELVKISKNGNWKGGLYIAGGYVKVKVKDHPKKDKRSYVLLHRLVMEEHLGRYLKDDEYIHHKDGNKLNNDISNLELVYPETHAKEHYSERMINRKTGKFICSEPKFNEIKFRLYDKDRQYTQEYSLGKLIYTKFKRNKFEYRGMSTGLKDHNGVLIYEGDFLKDLNGIWQVLWDEKEAAFYLYNKKRDFYLSPLIGEFEVIGNIHEKESK